MEFPPTKYRLSIEVTDESHLNKLLRLFYYSQCRLCKKVFLILTQNLKNTAQPGTIYAHSIILMHSRLKKNHEQPMSIY